MRTFASGSAAARRPAPSRSTAARRSRASSLTEPCGQPSPRSMACLATSWLSTSTASSMPEMTAPPSRVPSSAARSRIASKLLGSARSTLRADHRLRGGGMVRSVGTGVVGSRCTTGPLTAPPPPVTSMLTHSVPIQLTGYSKRKRSDHRKRAANSLRSSTLRNEASAIPAMSRAVQRSQRRSVHSSKAVVSAPGVPSAWWRRNSCTASQ